MSRRSGRRFADKDMRQSVNLEHIPIPQERDVLQPRSKVWRARHRCPFRALRAPQSIDLIIPACKPERGGSRKGSKGNAVRAQRMFRRSGYRFADKNMRK
jgi:hypothetical protein